MDIKNETLRRKKIEDKKLWKKEQSRKMKKIATCLAITFFSLSLFLLQNIAKKHKLGREYFL
jgi:hypothetical protein